MTDKQCVSFMKLVALFGMLTMLLLPGAVHTRGAFLSWLRLANVLLAPLARQG
jgi:hypothetical protein